MAPEEIINKFAYKFGNLDCLVFESPRPTKIVISFTGMNAGKYDRWSWYYDWHNTSAASEQTVYVVFRDEEHLFYLNRPGIEYQTEVLNFINSLMLKHSLANNALITVGSSMGGYAALYYGFLLEAGLSIASVPLVDIDSAALHQYTLWTRKMKEVGDAWMDLDKFLVDFRNAPDVFLIHGQYPADIASSDKLVKVFESIGCDFTREIVEEQTHEEFLTKSRLVHLIKNGTPTT